MKFLSKWAGGVMAVVLLAGPALAADAIVPGDVKSINADKKEFVMANALTGKDVTIKFGPDLVINRSRKESNSDLKVGDTVNVCHDNGTLIWTAHYILVQEGYHKDCVLLTGAVKSYAADTKELVFTDAKGKDVTYVMGDAKVLVNRAATKIGDIKIGDHALAIVEKIGDKQTLISLMVDRK